MGRSSYTEKEVDFAYLAGVFNVSGIDGLLKEIQRLKSLSLEPHDLILGSRNETFQDQEMKHFT